MKSFISTPFQCSLVLLISALFVSGCSSSSESNSGDSQTAVGLSGTNGGGVTPEDGASGGASEMDVATLSDTTGGTQTEPTDGTEESTSGNGTESTTASSVSASTTRVNFGITVPAFMSDALQVRLVWGDFDTTAIWNRDELWTATADFPANTASQLVVTFSDGNGSMTLGSFESSFSTGTSPSESFQIAADEFDTDSWDSDGDGVSNLSESIAGTNPQGSDALEPVQASLELVQDKTFRISWQPSEGAEFYRVLENSDGLSGFSQVGNDLGLSVRAFDHRVALYKRFNASYIVQSCNASGCTDSDALVVSGTLEQAIGYFKSSSNETRVRGVSLSGNGDTLVMGGQAVHVFARSNQTWNLEQILDAGTISLNALSDDGNTLVVGGQSVRVYVRDNQSWTLQSAIGKESADAIISGDGNTLVANKPREGVRSQGTGSGVDLYGTDITDWATQPPASGAVYVFARSNDTWIQEAHLLDSMASYDQNFGHSIAVSSDGNTLAVGVPKNNGSAGAAYVFTRLNSVWQEQSFLTSTYAAPDTGGDSSLSWFVPGDRFGWSVSLNADGTTLAVGSRSESSNATGIDGDETNNSAFWSGAAFVFTRSNESWQQQAYIKSSNTPRWSDNFGDSISLSANGDTLAIGAPGEDSPATGINGSQGSADTGSFSSGAVYLFRKIDEVWQQRAYLKASNTEKPLAHGFTDGATDEFGRSVSLSADGNSLAVEAPNEDSAATGINGDQQDNTNSNSGAVYLF